MHLLGHCIKVFPRRKLLPFRTETVSKPVTVVTGKDMEMDVRNCLTGRAPIGKKKS